MVAEYVRVWKRGLETLRASPEEHQAAVKGVDKAVVLAFRSRTLGVNVPNEYVAKYVDKQPDKLIGFCSVDPNEEEAVRELKRSIQDLHMQGLKLGPIYQHFDPTSEKAARVFAAAEELKIPVLIHQGTTFVRNAPLKYAYPSQLDEVGTRFDQLRIIVAHMGHPWEDETVALVRKQPNVYADVSTLISRPFRLYQKLLTCIEYGVTDKLLFGSDFPFSTPLLTIKALRNMNRYSRRAGLPRIPNDVINSIIERNALQLFGT